jgi:DNA polymerase-1
MIVLMVLRMASGKLLSRPGQVYFEDLFEYSGEMTPDQVLEIFKNEPPIALAVDTETTGFDWDINDYAFCMTLAWGTAGYNERDVTHNCVLWMNDENREGIYKILDWPCAKIFHNAVFDISFLRKYLGMKAPIPFQGRIDDTVVMSHIINENVSKELKARAAMYFGAQSRDEEKTLKEYFNRHGLRSYEEIPKDILVPYALKDAALTWRLFWYLWAKLRDQPSLMELYETMERPLIKIILEMAHTGMRFDVAFIHKLTETYVQKVKDDKIELTRLGMPEWVNLDSGKALGDYLVKNLGIDLPMTDGGGQYKTDLKTLSRVPHEIVDALVHYSRDQKILTTYTDGYLTRLGQDGRIHTRLNQVGTVTGRKSSNLPNLQNLPRKAEVRAAFLPTKGNILLFADYSQIELRLFAAYAKDVGMLTTIRDGGDLHGLTTELIFKFTKDEVDKQTWKDARQLAKKTNFSIIYGGGADTLENTFRTEPIGEYEDGRDRYMSNEEAYEYAARLGASDADLQYREPFRILAEQVLKAYRRGIPSAGKISRACMTKVKERGYVETLMHRRRRLDVEFGFKALNAVIQGGAADLLKWAMIRVHSFMVEQEMQGRMVLVVHDEIIFDLPEEEAILLGAHLPELMTAYEPLTNKVPIEIELSFSRKNWKEKQPFSELVEVV